MESAIPPTVPSEPSLPEPSSEPTPVSKRPGGRRGLWVALLVSLGLVSLMCMCVVVASVALGGGVLSMVTERPKVEATIDEFMRAMSDGDTEHAYSLFSPRAQRQVSISDIEAMLEGNNVYLFDGYRSVSIETLNLTAAATTNADAPQGTVANVKGAVEYRDGFVGTVEATLEKVDGQWRLHAIHVNIPPDKVP